ncbi:hypothetical protein BKI52_15410 [marine bacterium AO1-C]|nr:hypothetical protein BKI52_15410 [marine bacterium AO1-C]
MKLFLLMLIWGAFIVLFGHPLQAQDLSIAKTTSPIKVDGVMDETAWAKAAVTDQFHQYFPSDSIAAKAQTEVRLVYDDKYIYVLAKMHNLGPRKYVTPSLRRDFRGEANDVFTVVLDTYADRNNAFMFGVNPFGVQREGLIANGGAVIRFDTFSISWDSKWYSATKIYPDYWIAEMAIPFSSVRFKADNDQWLVNFYRFDSEYAEQSTWAPIPQNQLIINLAFSKKLQWDQAPRNKGANMVVIPYVAAGSTKNFEPNLANDNNVNAGLDAKIGLSTALNLDLTVNPDFSQVEVDQQVTNLDRFEIFFPEKRQFFQENADLFANFGLAGTRPFFSRRIGVVRDASTGQNLQNPIYFGARLSGKLNPGLRIGVLSMQAGEDASVNLPSTNYTVTALQQRIAQRSFVSLILVNKQAFQDSIAGSFDVSPNQFNRMIGLDVNLATKNNVWNSKFFYHRSFDDLGLDSSFAAGGYIIYNTRRWVVDVTAQNIGNHYNPAVGFVRRRDIVQATPQIWYNRYPTGGLIQRHGPGISGDVVANPALALLDWNTSLNYRIAFRNTALLNFSARRSFIQLRFPFDPSGTGGLPLETGTNYLNNQLVASFRSDARKRFFFNLSSQIGEYFNGERYQLGGELTYRFQPWGFVSLNFNYNHIQLPQPYQSADLSLVGTRIDLTFTKNLFWTTFVQYNGQINNLNINSRLQWRFKPVSDLFLVYTDNYFADDQNQNGDFVLLQVRQPKLRAIVFKLTYWLNL